MKSLFKFSSILFILVISFLACQKNEDNSGSPNNISKELTFEKKIMDLLKSNGFNLVSNAHIRNTVTNGCYSPIGASEFCIENAFATIITLPEYTSPLHGTRPRCTDMQVSYTMRICYDPNTFLVTKFVFNNFSANYGSGCPEFDAWYKSLPNSEKGAAQDKYEYDASFILEQLAISALSGVVTSCQLPITNWQTESEFLLELCFRRCLIPFDEFPGFKIVKNYCGTQCCVRTRPLCRNNSNIVIFFNPTFSTLGTSCTASTVSNCVNGIPIDPVCGKICGPLY